MSEASATPQSEKEKKIIPRRCLYRTVTYSPEIRIVQSLQTRKLNSGVVSTKKKFPPHN